MRLLFWERHAAMVQLVAYWYSEVHQPASATVVGIGEIHQLAISQEIKTCSGPR
jgi:hypothetical protein